MAYSAAAIANALIDIAANNGTFLSNLKLQKMVYFAHGWYLALAEEPLICEDVQSWKYGPVIQELYEELKHYGSSPVTKKINTPDEVDSRNEDFAFLEQIYATYGVFSPAQLIALTHEPGSPWDQFGAGRMHYQVIPNAIIQRDFSSKLKKD